MRRQGVRAKGLAGRALVGTGHVAGRALAGTGSMARKLMKNVSMKKRGLSAEEEEEEEEESPLPASTATALVSPDAVGSEETREPPGRREGTSSSTSVDIAASYHWPVRVRGRETCV